MATRRSIPHPVAQQTADSQGSTTHFQGREVTRISKQGELFNPSLECLASWVSILVLCEAKHWALVGGVLGRCTSGAVREEWKSGRIVGRCEEWEQAEWRTHECTARILWVPVEAAKHILAENVGRVAMSTT